MSDANISIAGATMRSKIWNRANIHFMIAVVILGVTAGGWHAAIRAFQWYTVKLAVTWPEGVVVDNKEFRNTSLPTKFGPYIQMERGDFVIPPDVLDPLRIGTAQDEARVGQRRSNWYISRPCVDTRVKDQRGRFTTYWQMNVFYYTGVVDKVPHVPDACLVAGGASLIGTSRVMFTVPDLAGQWGKPLPFNRTLFLRKNRGEGPGRKHVQYYIFVFNGEPEASELVVRRKLTYPWIKHSYFAKIELAPNAPIVDLAEADRAAEEFLRQFLPSVLKTLPTSDDIKRLDEAERN